MIFYATEEKLENCVLPELQDLFDRERSSIFEDPTSLQAQMGRLKHEGVYSAGWFRTIKSYYLKGRTDEESDLFRMKGVSQMVQRQMTDVEFHVGETDASYFHSFALRPSAGGEMTINLMRRQNNSCFNFKRSMHQVGGPAGGMPAPEMHLVAVTSNSRLHSRFFSESHSYVAPGLSSVERQKNNRKLNGPLYTLCISYFIQSLGGFWVRGQNWADESGEEQ